MKILALDLATRTGWAFGDENRLQGSGSHRFTGKAPQLLSELHRWASALIGDELPDLVAFESPFTRGAGSKLLHRMGGIIQMACWPSVNVTEIPPTTIKKFITGKGNASKEDVVQAVRTRGHEPENDDEADAIALFLYVQDWDQEAA